MLLNNVNSQIWQQKLGNSGEIVTGVEDIEQCITIAIRTRKGSIPHDPNFGNDAYKWIDKPVNVAVPNIIRCTVDCINYCVKRATVKSCNVSTKGEKTVLGLKWALNISEDEERTLEVIL